MEEELLSLEETIAIKNEPLWIDSAVEVKIEQAEQVHARDSVEAIPSQHTKVKQELEFEYYFNVENYPEAKVKKSLDSEIDSSTLKYENTFEAAYNKERTKMKQELKSEECCKDRGNFQEAINVEKEFKHEFLHSTIDLRTVKNENKFEVGCSKKFQINRRNQFACPVCQKHYPLCKSRNEHFLNHFMKEPVLCYCGKFFTQPFLFLRHYFVHFVKDSKSLNSLKRKYQRSKVEIDHLFGNCSRPFSKKTNLIKHSRIRLGEEQFKYEKPFKCKICLKQFRQKYGLTVHSRIHTGEKSQQCKICLKRFSRNSYLRKHIRTHTTEKRYKCKICLKQFSVKYSLNIHSRTHTGEKPYKCKICLKQFSVKYSLNIHSRTHTGEKPYKCKICLKQFSLKDSLTKHSRTHTGEKPYECKICLKQFSAKHSLNNHSRTHTGEKPYKCKICLKQFSAKYSLNMHFRTHTGEKPYKCKICLKTFILKQGLDYHSRTHTDQKPYKCKTCLKQFTSKQNLNNHSRTHTGEMKKGDETSQQTMLLLHSLGYSQQWPTSCPLFVVKALSQNDI